MTSLLERLKVPFQPSYSTPLTFFNVLFPAILYPPTLDFCDGSEHICSPFRNLADLMYIRLNEDPRVRNDIDQFPVSR